MSFFRSLLRAASRYYQRIFKRRVDAQTRETVELLRRVPALSHLSSRALYAMAGVAHRRTYKRGEVLYYEGDPGLGLYIIESGRIRLVTDDDPEGTHELREIREDEMLGGVSLLGDFQRLETAETLTDARVVGFFRPDLKNVMRRDPKAGGEITMALARNLAVHHVNLIRQFEELQDRTTTLRAYAEAARSMDVDVSPEAQ